MTESKQSSRQLFDEWGRLNEPVAESLIKDADFVTQLLRVWQASEYIQVICQRQPQLLIDFHADHLSAQPVTAGQIDEDLKISLGQAQDEADLHRRLRQFRRLQMMRIIWRDICNQADLAEVTAALSALADSSIRHTLDWLEPRLVEQFGQPRDANGRALSMMVIGMGKLGAAELNLSSDIDLIYAYDCQGETDGRRARSNSEFFIRLGQQLTHALDTQDANGFVFRVDLRLRPFGGAGPLAVSLDAMEDYYLLQGREWERYAMIKARVIRAGRQERQRFEEMIRPFVFRRYLDYAAIDSMRDMKRMINQQLYKKGARSNIKLGPGGIREIEFIGQVFQLIRGGYERSLQIRPILQVLQLLQEQQQLPAETVSDLSLAYDFLRRVEHRLQAWKDEQTQLLPADEEGRQRLANAMNFTSWDAFLPVLDEHRNRVQQHFDALLAVQDEEKQQQQDWYALLQQEDTADLHAALKPYFNDVAAAAAQLSRLLGSRALRVQTERGRNLTMRLLPQMIQAAAEQSDADQALANMLPIVEAIAGRTAYIALLLEQPGALAQLARLCAASRWISGMITQHPLLLDDLLDSRRLQTPLQQQDLQLELQQQLAQADADDVEQLLNQYRHFLHSQLLRVAAADVQAVIPVMQVSDYLSDIAEVLLQSIIRRVSDEMALKHGYPPATDALHNGFAVIAYGKLGGLELGYGSDLDLVFVHGCDDLYAQTDGEKPLSNEVYYVRFGQRLIYWLTTLTAAGALYEVDMRLRPNGQSGLLTVSLQSFEKYQLEEAWTWEHQALVRARVVAGDSQVAQGFEQIRQNILRRPRDAEKLRRDVVEMRETMRNQLLNTEAGEFDLKQGRGGIADIEFMVQYAVLRWAGEYPQLLRWTDNIRLLQTLAELDLMAASDAAALGDAYRELRVLYHRCALQQVAAKVSDNGLSEQRAMVVRMWQSLMES
ncbi:MAG: bifunctional [glutamate--ammonia ligase]-adenylyl-L-tyrosine phosphorylase/[glutamate--ammonia-ligase] adenylyltransferase [gamma proteobacterium symbiont of Bathyaustriella thionipta]|nr:bifunctional [glutamate--ammonia ligase]-adenylyl-L-tyrosine phosphorylase/[glutamate--ammonia-ligase] adenylyltransferase [gamma proteobacterium symbiont of Bathyaustriella thionipta]